MSDDIFVKYGRARVREIVADFYAKVLDSHLAHYFEDASIRTLVNHQAAFMGAVMGGPVSHSDENLKTVHAALHVTDADFEYLVGLLRETLDEARVESGDAELIVGRYLATRSLIVSE